MENDIVNQPGPDFETGSPKQNQVVNEQEQNKAVNGGDTFQNTQTGNIERNSGNKSDGDSNDEQQGSGDAEIETPTKKEGGSAEKTEKKIPNY